MPDTLQVRKLKTTLRNTRRALKHEYNGRKEAEGLAKTMAFRIQALEKMREALIDRVNRMRNS